MDLPTIPLATFQAFLVCLARVGAMVAAMPVLGSRQAPVQVKVGLAVLIALAIFPVVNETVPRFDFEPVALGLLVGREVMVGAAAAFVAQLAFLAVEFGAAVVGFNMGFAAANVFDPVNQEQSQVLSQFQSVLAVLIFLALDGHHIVFRALVRSFTLLPPGTADVGGAAPFLVRMIGEAFVLGIQICAPVLVVLVLVNLILGVMSRVFPQLNVFALSFPLNIGIAFLIMGLTFQVMTSLLGREFGRLEERFLALFQAM